MKILAVKWRRLGDTVLWTAALDALRAHYPDAEIDIAFDAGYADLFANDPRFAHAFALQEDAASLRNVTRAWRARAYDLALGFHVSHRVRRLVESAGARERILHHHSRDAKNFGSQRRVVALGQPMSAIERDLNVVRTLGWAGASPEPRVLAAAERVAAARETWDPARPVVLLGPAASRPAKQWPLERYVALARRLAPRAGVGILYDDERAFRGYSRLRRELAATARLVATPRLADAMAHLAAARAYAGSDSGIKHLAAALGTATVTFFGPESIAEWHGYDERRHRALQAAVGCRTRDAEADPRFAWCGEALCPLASHACLNLISVDEAASAIEGFL